MAIKLKRVPAIARGLCYGCYFYESDNGDCPSCDNKLLKKYPMGKLTCSNPSKIFIEVK